VKEIKEPKVIDIFRHVDDRGTLDMIFNSDLPFCVRRIYCTMSRKKVIRGMHGHLNEWKAFYVLKGSIKIVAQPMKLVEHKSKLLSIGVGEPKEFVLSDTKPQIFILPPGYFHGYCSLTPEARVVILSSVTLKETKLDDHRIDPGPYRKYFEVKSR